MISVFDLYKIGIGPSSSHTMGPMVAAKRFRGMLPSGGASCSRIEVTLYGSLAWTAKGHGTDRAVCLGLLDQEPESVDPDGVDAMMRQLADERRIALACGHRIAFDPQSDLVLEKKEIMPRHSNAMRFRALAGSGDDAICEEIFYSIGGGFVVTAEEDGDGGHRSPPPFAFRSVSSLLTMAMATGQPIADLQRSNERVWRSDAEIDAGLDRIAETMFACIDRGMAMEGHLPGGLKVRRRAASIARQLQADAGSNAALPHERLDWVSVYALAVNEENAAGGRIVTAPTNGAAGIVPAVLRYYRDFYLDFTQKGIRDFLLTSAAIGSLIKTNASISGAEVGCQGEVGSAAAMAAAGLAAVSGGTPQQIENAAEIALEHHLGMTCDPIAGLVQIPCIERNAIGAQKAIAAASLSLRGDGSHRVSLDEVIETMRQTGMDMAVKYKETSLGGLAVNVAEC